MSRTYSQLQQLVDTKLSKAAGTLTASDYQAQMNLALDKFRLEIDLPQLLNTQLLSPALFRDVIYYSIPSDLTNNSITSFRPIVEINGPFIDNTWTQVQDTEFDRNLVGPQSLNRWTIEYNNGQRMLKMFAHPFVNAENTIIDACDDLTANGTWTAYTSGSDAANIVENKQDFFEGSGSIQFDIDVSQSVNNYAIIYKAFDTSIDLSGFDRNAYLFSYLNLPGDVSNITSVNITLGSNSGATPATKTDYYTYTATSQFNSVAFQEDRNLLGIIKSSEVATGSPDLSQTFYVEIKVNYGVAQVDMSAVLVDGLYFREGVFMQIRYFSENAVRSVLDVPKPYFTADDDTTVLDSQAESAFIDFACGEIANSIRDFPNADVYVKRAKESIFEYRSTNPSSRSAITRNWYFYSGNAPRIDQAGFRRHLGW